MSGIGTIQEGRVPLRELDTREALFELQLVVGFVCLFGFAFWTTCNCAYWRVEKRANSATTSVLI